MTDRESLDKLITFGPMPIEALRMLLTESAPSKAHTTDWRFYVGP